MKTQFKIGDKIKIIKNLSADFFDKYIDEICVVENVYEESGNRYSVDLRVSNGKSYRWVSEEIELYVDQRAQMIEIENSL